MKQSVLVVTTVLILLSGIVAITLIQSTEASVISTTRSNIKSSGNAMKPKGNDNQLSLLEVMVSQSSQVDNNCGDGTDCPVVATNTMGDISDGGSTREQTISVDVGDISKSVSDNSNSFEGDPIPGVDVKLGKNPGGLFCC